MQKNRRAPISLGPTALHYSKEKVVYKKIVTAVSNSAPSLAKNGIGYITDVGINKFYWPSVLQAFSAKLPRKTPQTWRPTEAAAEVFY